MPNYKPMLACDWDESKLKFPYMAQPKIDGVRGVKFDQFLTGRTLKRFDNSYAEAHLFASEIFTGIDGELALSGQTCSSSLCRDTTGALNRFAGTPNLIWHGFDYITEATINLPYLQRYDTLKYLIEAMPDEEQAKLVLMYYEMVHSLADILAVEETWIDMGYEGVILRDPQGMYKQGRCTARENALLRIKRFVEEDAVVIELQEAMQNNNEAVINELGRTERSSHQENKEGKGMVGALICNEAKTGKIITVGPGAMTHAERKMYWNSPNLLVGRTIKYKLFPHGRKDKPRFPTFVTIRADADTIKPKNKLLYKREEAYAAPAHGAPYMPAPVNPADWIPD